MNLTDAKKEIERIRQQTISASSSIQNNSTSYTPTQISSIDDAKHEITNIAKSLGWTGQTQETITPSTTTQPVADATEKKSFWSKIINKPSYFDDGWQFGDVIRTGISTVGQGLTSAGKGFVGSLEGVIDFGGYALKDILQNVFNTDTTELGDFLDWNMTSTLFGENDIANNLEVINRMRERQGLSKWNTSSNENLYWGKSAEDPGTWGEELNKKSLAGTWVRGAEEGVGNMAGLALVGAGAGQLVAGALPSTAPTAALQAAGKYSTSQLAGSMFASFSMGYGATRSQAKREGYSDAEAMRAGIIGGFAETISEQMFDAVKDIAATGWGSSITNLAGRVIPAGIKTSVGKFFGTAVGKRILSALEEGTEEIVSNMLTAIGNDIAYYVDNTYQANGMENQTGNIIIDTWNAATSEESIDAFISAAITAGFLAGDTYISNQEKEQIIEDYAKDNNISKEEAQAILDGKEQEQGQSEDTIQKTIYDNTNTLLSIEEISQMTDIPALETLLTQLREDYTNPNVNVRDISTQALQPIFDRTKAVENRLNELLAKAPEPVKTDVYNDAVNEMEKSLDNPNDTPVVKAEKVRQVNKAAETIDDTQNVIKIGENKKQVRVRYNQVEEDAIGYINAWNQERLTQQLRPITVIRRVDWTQDQIRIAEALEAFGRHAVFARDLPGSFVTAETSGQTDLSQVLFINDKNINGLISKSNVTKDNQAMMYAVGHEMFHSLRFEKPEIYNDLVDYVANTISTDQIRKFMEMYDPQDTQGLLKNTQIDGKFNIEEVLANPKKYATQYQALFSIAEEMTANEFGGMFTDVEYMTNMAQKVPDLFTKIVNAIKEFFRDLDRPIYNSPLTQLQITTLRENFESIMKEVDNSLSTTKGKVEAIEQTKVNGLEQNGTENDVQNEESVETRSTSAEKETQSKPVRQEKKPVTKWATVKEAYNKANESKNIDDLNAARDIYATYLDEGRARSAGLETDLDTLEKEILSENEPQVEESVEEKKKPLEKPKNTVKKSESTRQKEQKITQQVNTNEQVEKPTRQVLKKEVTQETKLPTKETETPAYISEFDTNMRGGKSNAYLVFEDTIEDNKLKTDEIETLRKHAIETAKDKETKDAIRNWTPEVLEQETTIIEETKSKQKDIDDTNKSKNDLYNKAKTQYELLLESGLDSTRKKAKQYYKEYKDAGGRRIIEGLEEIQEPKLPKKESTTKEVKSEPVVNQDVKVSTLSLDDRYKMITRQYDRYKKVSPSQKTMLLNGLITSYNAYKQNGGTEIITELENYSEKDKSQIEADARQAFKENLLRRMLPTAEQIEAQTPYGMETSRLATNTILNTEIMTDAEIEDVLNDTNVRDYKKITNEESINEAARLLRRDKIDKSYYNIIDKDSLSSVDVALGAMILQYMKGKPMLRGARKALWRHIREFGTEYGRTIQSLKLLKVIDADTFLEDIQDMLAESLEKIRDKAQSDATLRAWLREQGASNLELSEAEQMWITEMFEKANKMDPDSREYKVTLARVYAYIAGKIPKSFTSKLKEYRRIAMLANMKTQMRNFLANVGALPINFLGDTFGVLADKELYKRTGVRTQGLPDFKEQWRGAQQGLQYSNEDRRMGINTQDINAYEQQNGDIFDNTKAVGRFLNGLNRLTNFGLDLGDRPFWQAAYNNALHNILVLNNRTEATETDKFLATREADEKTWKNKGLMANLAISIRNAANKVHIQDIGLGDIILPFVLTPANLAAATYKYSPAALASVVKDIRSFNKLMKNPTATIDEKMIAQKKVVDSWGKMCAGTVLYILAGIVAKAGITTGDEDDDKDVAAMMKSLGWQKYSVKIGDKYYSYDWVEPIASPFAVMSEIERQEQNGEFDKHTELGKMMEVIAQAFNIAGTRIQDQSFLSGIQSIFSAHDSFAEGLIDFSADLPASFVPTAVKQVADIVDGRTKMTYDKNSILNTALNKVAAKIPGLKSKLPTKQTTLGNDMYTLPNADSYRLGVIGKAFQSMFSPSNISLDTSGEIGEEFFDVYARTGDKSIMPQIAIKSLNYDSNGDGNTESYQLTLEQQSNLQKEMGTIVTNGMNELMFNDVYNTASYEQKATALTSLVQYAKGKALENTGYIPNYQIKSGNAAQINNYTNAGLSVGEAVMYDSLINPIKSDKDEEGKTVTGSQNGKKAYTIMDMAISDASKDVMLHLISPTATNPETTQSLGYLTTEDEFISYYALPRHDNFVNNKYSRDDLDIAKNYFNFDAVDFTNYANNLANIKSDKDANGVTVANSKKRKIIDYINTLPISSMQKVYLYGISGYSVKQWSGELYNYINGLNISAEKKRELWEQLGL